MRRAKPKRISKLTVKAGSGGKTICRNTKKRPKGEQVNPDASVGRKACSSLGRAIYSKLEKKRFQSLVMNHACGFPRR